MKFKYIPGMRPTPMLMYYKKANEKVFYEESRAFKKGEYISKFNHIWNIGAYLIYDDNLEVVTYRIVDVNNFLWLLRIINKEIIIDFNEDFIINNQEFIKEAPKELITI